MFEKVDASVVDSTILLWTIEGPTNNVSHGNLQIRMQFLMT
jgi:hypothetical protein